MCAKFEAGARNRLTTPEAAMTHELVSCRASNTNIRHWTLEFCSARPGLAILSNPMFLCQLSVLN